MSTSVSANAPSAREERWKQEAAFFDDVAQKTDVSALRIDPLALQRYTRPVLLRRFSMEHRIRILGPLEGKAVLDVGCGDGLNVPLFARMGAQVTGIDVSSGALEVARRRAEANGAASRVRLVCAPIERAVLPGGSFDVVWCDGFLHHVLEDLELVLERLVHWTRPGGLLVFSEPINLCQALRRVRRLIPVRTDSTPGERPMHSPELALVRRYVPDLRIRHYSLLGRLDRFVLGSFNYERSSSVRRAIVSGLACLDWLLLSLPGVRSLAGTCVMYGHRSRPGEVPRDDTRSRSGASSPRRAVSTRRRTLMACPGVFALA